MSPIPKGGDDVRKAQAIFQVAEWIKDHSYDLEPKTEVVDGSTCVILKGSLNSILQPGFLAGDLTDRIWLDRDHGLVVRKREMARDGKVIDPLGEHRLEGSRARNLAADDHAAGTVPREAAFPS